MMYFIEIMLYCILVWVFLMSLCLTILVYLKGGPDDFVKYLSEDEK